MATILIVDDDHGNIRLLKKILTHEQYRVQTAYGGREALESIDSAQPDLVLLDIMMPELDGFEVTRRLRKNPRFAHLPIIVVSARGQTEDITRGLDEGANDYLTKPIILAELLARVRTQLRLKSVQDKLTRANQELWELSELKGRLVAVVSHELRTPLTSIRGALDLVTKQATEQLEKKHIKLLDISLRNTDRLIGLINDVLEFARLEGGGFDLERRPVLVATLISGAVEELEALTEPHGIAMVTELEKGLPDILADGARLHQVLVNLLSNAVKYSEAGTSVTIRAGQELRGDEGASWVRISVTDQGCGIPPEALKKLFLPFQQFGHPVQRLGGSTGLGLAISRQIVALHDGTISVESQAGRGSTFSFAVPVARKECSA